MVDEFASGEPTDNEIEAYLDILGVPSACPACNNAVMLPFREAIEDITKVEFELDGKNIKSNLRSVLFVCVRCGFTRKHALLPIESHLRSKKTAKKESAEDSDG